MIFINKKNVEEKDFIDLLFATKGLIVTEIKRNISISPDNFESLVYEKMKVASKGSGFEGMVIQTGTFAFPDIIANKYFGVEVKMTSQNHWKSTGNSVLESSRIEGIKRIYIMFGKLGGDPDVKYRLYQECLPEVTVTHSPRYQINMNLEKGSSIFDKIGINYDTLRQSNPIKKIKDYYRNRLKDGEELWWIDSEDEDKSVSPIIKPYRLLSETEKENFIVESFILFPEIFSGKQTKFERPAAYLITKYNAVSYNLRDVFTAGGRRKIEVGGTYAVVPKLLYKFQKKAKAIKEKLFSIDEEQLYHYWKAKSISDDREKQWLFFTEKYYNGKPKRFLSQVYVSGLNGTSLA